MPSLYTKLVEAKKGVISDTVIPLDNNFSSTQPKMKKLPSSLEESLAQPSNNKKKSYQEDE